jgi:Exportin 1-like protein
MATPADLLALLNSVRSALSALHAAVPDPDAVRQAQAALDRVKTSLSIPASLELGAGLLSPILSASPTMLSPADMPAVHFGFHVIDERVLLPDWMSVAGDRDRAQLRSLAQTALVRVSSPAARRCFPGWVRQKAAALVAALAMREWPQCWPDFVDGLFALARTNEGVPGIACEVFRALSDEVHEFGDGISSRRRAELCKALTVSEDAMLGFVTACAQRFFDARDDAGLAVALATLTSLMSWCDMPKALTANVPTACIAMLKYEPVRDTALEALSVFVARKVPCTSSAVSAASEPATTLMRDVLFPAVLEFVATTPLVRIVSNSSLPVCEGYFASSATAAAQADFAASVAGAVDGGIHDFSVRFVELLSVLGQTHFGLCFLPYQLVPTDMSAVHYSVAIAFVDLMLAAAGHPSVLVKGAAMRYFATAFTRTKKGPKKSKTTEPAHGSVEAALATQTGTQVLFDMAVGFVHAGSLALVKNSSDPLTEQYAALDFEGDDGEHRDALIGIRNRVIAALGQASACWPSDAFPLAIQRLSSVLETAASARRSGVSLTAEDKGASASRRPLATKAAHSTHRHAWVLLPFSATEGPLLLSCADAIVTASEALVAGCVSSGILPVGGSGQNASFEREFERLFDSVAGLEDVQLQHVKVSALRMFIPLFLKDNRRLTQALSSLVALASGDGLPNEARLRASSSLAALCRRVARSEASSEAQALSSVRQPLCEFVAPMLVQRNRSSLEKVHLLEAAVTCVGTLKTVGERTLWMEKLLRPLMQAVSPSQTWCQSAFRSPTSLMAFVEDERSPTCSAFFLSLCLVETTTHQVVRDASHSLGPLTLPNSLSNSIAPLCVDLAVQLVPLLHGMYDVVKFPSLTDARCQSALLPTSREVACLLDLDVSSFLTAIQVPDVDDSGIVVDTGILERSDDKLRQFGVEPPDLTHQRARETLRLLRIGSYEIIRNSLLSGVTRSPDHLRRVVDSVCCSYQYLEPLHVYYLVHRIVRVLVSYQVVATDPSFIPAVSTSPGICNIIKLMNEQIEAIGANSIVSSSNTILDLAREHGRVHLCRAAADLATGMFPKLTRSSAISEAPLTDSSVSAPAPLHGETALSNALWSLLRTLCGPGVASADPGSSRAVCDTIGRAVHHAPEEMAHRFSEVLVACFQTAVCTFGGDANDVYLIAMVEVAMRYPSSSMHALGEWIKGESDAVQEWIKSTFTELLNPGEADVAASSKSGTDGQRKKSGRGLLRHLIKRIREETGLSTAKNKKVRSLPKSLQMKKLASQAEAHGDDDELILGEQALDSLFGDGPPL